MYQRKIKLGMYVTSVLKKPGQTTVVIQYYSLSRFPDVVRKVYLNGIVYLLFLDISTSFSLAVHLGSIYDLASR